MLGFSVNPEAQNVCSLEAIAQKEAAKKTDGAKTRSWAGATPLFGPSVSKVTHGSLPPIGATCSAECFGPLATGREKRRELEERKEKASATILPLSTGNPTYSCQGSRATPHLVWTCGGNRPASRRTVRTDSR